MEFIRSARIVLGKTMFQLEAYRTRDCNPTPLVSLLVVRKEGGQDILEHAEILPSPELTRVAPPQGVEGEKTPGWMARHMLAFAVKEHSGFFPSTFSPAYVEALRAIEFVIAK